MSEEEARNNVSELQDKNSLNSIIERCGKIEGMKIYENILKKLSYSHSLEGYIERYGTKGESIYKNHIAKKTSELCSTSKESILFFIQ
jgi:hypothetical protein